MTIFARKRYAKVDNSRFKPVSALIRLGLSSSPHAESMFELRDLHGKVGSYITQNIDKLDRYPGGSDTFMV